MTTVPDADLTAIYCRKSIKGDKQQITVNRQKQLALADCNKLGLVVTPENIFVDNGASAWQRNRKRPGWDALIAAARRGEIKHIVCYHPDRLMRQPFDLEELLSISDEFGIMLYGRVNARNMQDPDDRYALRIEIAHACRASDDTSRRVKDQKHERAESGLPNGARAYGYSKNGLAVIPHEGEIVREIFERFTRGETPYAIAADLNRRAILTAKGGAWSEAAIRRTLHNKHAAGICWYRGKEIAVGQWPAIIERSKWDFAQELLAFRSPAMVQRTKNRRTYILRGLVICGNCGTVMAGCSGSVYRCSRAQRQDGKRCARGMAAEPLEKFVEDAAVTLLIKLSVSRKRSPNASVARAEREIADDERQLRELNEMWKNKEIDTSEYREMRRDIRARVQANQRKTLVTARSIESIADLIGPDAPAKWKRLTDERKNSVLRFLLGAVIIGPGKRTGDTGTIDFGRVDIEENDLS